MHRRSIHVQSKRSFNNEEMPLHYLSGFSYRFQQLSQSHGQVIYVLLTRSPLSLFGSKLPKDFVRLACIRHAASVHPEPGSNSPFDLAQTLLPTSCFFVIYWNMICSYLIEINVFPVQFSKTDFSCAPLSACI